MPDIMMCAADQCELSKSCRRHADSGTQPDPYRQSYWWRDDNPPTGEECPNFWVKRTGGDDA